ncbi:hypothetical protein [Xylanibacter ruminicola]|uniref:hypothetical protein n=1 Tax=Xylanibacter ruminicola TaxID=839 RepID=UPI000CDE5BED|nr:hypothetical protein [Xylanibacter ruminicola]
MNIPNVVEKAASHLTKQFDCGVRCMGKYKGKEAYIANLPDDVTIGFPEVYLYKDGKVEVVGVPLSFDIIDAFVEDVNELDVE